MTIGANKTDNSGSLPRDARTALGRARMDVIADLVPPELCERALRARERHERWDKLRHPIQALRAFVAMRVFIRQARASSEIPRETQEYQSRTGEWLTDVAAMRNAVAQVWVSAIATAIESDVVAATIVLGGDLFPPFPRSPSFAGYRSWSGIVVHHCAYRITESGARALLAAFAERVRATIAVDPGAAFEVLDDVVVRKDGADYVAECRPTRDVSNRT